VFVYDAARAKEEPMTRLEYEGPVYIRPVERGILLDWDPAGDDDRDLVDAITELVADKGYTRGGGWEGRLRITVEVLEDALPHDA
jgi:hypothetical protein